MIDVSIDLVKLNEMTESVREVQCPVTHHFAPEVYVREVFMPAGSLVLGHRHLTEHLNIMVTGRMLVYMGDKVEELVAPCTFVSPAGVQKAANILEDCIWQTVHPNPENIDNVETLEHGLISKDCSEVPLKELTNLTCPSLP